MMQTQLTWTCVCCARHTVYRILNFMKKSAEQGPWYSGVLISATLRLNFHYGSYPPFSCTDLQSTATVHHIISFYPVCKRAKWRWNPSNFRERLLVFNFLKLGGTPAAFIVHTCTVHVQYRSARIVFWVTAQILTTCFLVQFGVKYWGQIGTENIIYAKIWVIVNLFKDHNLLTSVPKKLVMIHLEVGRSWFRVNRSLINL